MDALVIATPHVHHYPIAAAAIARGIHVLIEKPLVLDPADGRRLIDAAAAAGVEIVVGYTWHYNEQVLTARRWIADGRIGSIVYVQSFFGSSPVNLYRGEPEADVYAYGAGDALTVRSSPPTRIRISRAVARARRSSPTASPCCCSSPGSTRSGSPRSWNRGRRPSMSSTP